MQQNTKKNIEDIYELTPMQQGMLFHTLYKEGSDAYFEQFCYDLSGNLDEEIFKRAWKEVINRHSVLRTSFQWKGISKPVQLVNKVVELPWINFDWSNLTKEQQQEEFKKFIKQDRTKGFLMENAPLMRCTLIKIDNDSYQFVWSFHHILIDGWSYPILLKEVFTIYKAIKEKKEISLPRPLPYKQFILWLNQQDKLAAEKYWKEELKGFNSPTLLTVNFELGIRNYESQNEIDELGIKLSNELTSKLQSLAKQNQLTLNTLFQGVWAIILSTYRGESDVLFGGVISGRTSLLKDIDRMVGLFINTLPVRVNVDKEKGIDSWLRELQANHIERDQYSYSSLVDIQECSEIPRGTGLFENILVFENYPLDKSLENGVAGIKINNLKAFERTNFPLTILIIPGEPFTIRIAYKTSKFDNSSIKKILTNFKTLLEGIVNNPESKIYELTLLSDSELEVILKKWNDTDFMFEEFDCVHRIIETQTNKTPDAVAVLYEDESITYSELNRRSNQFARYLNKLGVKPETLVGICVERSIEMVVGVLGILKAGGAYVPLDPSYPKNRLEFMVKDTESKILITQKRLVGNLPDNISNVVLIDEDWKNISKEKDDNFNCGVKLSNLAYIIYTSGSTGIPKGVMITHEGIANQMLWMKSAFSVDSSDSLLLKSSFSFDASVCELFLPLLSGGRLVIAIPDGQRDPAYLVKTIIAKNITKLLVIVPSLLRELLNEKEFENCKSLKSVFCGAEALPFDLKELLFEKLSVDFYNLYGPTEASIVATYFKCNSNSNQNIIPIGNPVYNTQAYILDKYLKPVPIGVSGELHIGGIQVARGYYNSKELTELKFIPNHFDKKNGARLYKTGDLVRYLPDGNIEYLGRVDNQIKIRGFRIELGEIETILNEYRNLKNTVVIAREFNPGDKRLVAYIIPNQEPAPKSTELRNYLKSKLPEYMIPSDFIVLNEFPMTSSGKIDLRALPNPEAVRINESDNYIEPKETLELQLVKIWEKVLGVKPIGIKDNFFDLGGHSLLALRVFGYIEKLTGKKLPLSTLFDSPTIKQLAVILKEEGWSPPWKSLVAVQPGGSKPPFYCVPLAAGTALHFQSLVKYLPEDQPFYVLESIGLDGKEQPHTKLEDMASFYVKEIQTLQPEGPYLLGGRCFGGRVAFEMAQQLTKLGQKVALLAIFDTWPPFIAPPPSYDLPIRDLKYFITRSFYHLKTGELGKIMWKYTSNKAEKVYWKVKDKLGYIFSDEKKKLYKRIMLIHFKAQDNYIAKKYSGKVTLVECETFKRECREGWKNLAEGGFEHYVIPNTNHKTIVKEPKLRDFAEKLNFILEKTHNELNANLKSNGAVLKKKEPLEEINV